MCKPSDGNHYAGVTAVFLPTDILFAPSIDGVSHSFAEDTNADDSALGCQVLADATGALLRARRRFPGSSGHSLPARWIRN